MSENITTETADAVEATLTPAQKAKVKAKAQKVKAKEREKAKAAAAKARAAEKAKPEVRPEFEKGSWQHTLSRSTDLLDKSGKDRTRASALLWEGAIAAIDEALSADRTQEDVFESVKEALGARRKGDASKIGTVYRAARDAGLDITEYANLSKAYAEARRLTETVKIEAKEDSVAETVVESIKAEAPKTTSKPEGAAQILLAQGLDEAARLLVDAMGSDQQAHRALLRALSQEVAGRAKVEKVEKVKSDKGAATPATATPAQPKATAKPKAAQPKAAQPAAAKPVVATAKPAVAKPAVAKPAVAKPAVAKPA